jgi:hypothetical protein
MRTREVMMGTRWQASNVFRGQFLAHFGEVPQCDTCRHLWADGDAFPDGIPSDIITNGYDHHQAFTGDDGIRYEEGEPAYRYGERTAPDGHFAA